MAFGSSSIRTFTSGALAACVSASVLVGLSTPASAAALSSPVCPAGTSISVTTPQGLYDATTCGVGKTVTLATDIDMTGYTGWVPQVFGGTFDGNGKTVSGLAISTTTTDAGFFDTLDSATVSNLTLSGISVSQSQAFSGSAIGAVGALAAQSVNSTVTNTVVSGSSAVSTVNVYAGGLIGSASGTGSIASSSSSATVTQTTNNNPLGVGGLVGNSAVAISGSSASGNVTGQQRVGGLVGVASAGVSNSSATGRVTGTNAAGGSTGGLIGIASSTISNSYYAGPVVTAPTYSVSGYADTGGLVGVATGAISNAYATGTVYGCNKVGGLVGNSGAGGSVTDSYTTNGSVTSYAGCVNFGGLVGYQAANITRSYSTMSIRASTGAATTNAGGLVGYASSGATAMSFASGAVEGKGTVGGLIGALAGGSVTDAFASGAVIGTGNVGGLVGARTSGTATNSYAIGAVSLSSGTASSIGGLFGGGSAGPAASFWDTATTGQATSAGGAGAVGKSTAQMKSYSTFDTAGWSIYDGWEAVATKTWGICTDNGYPFLRWYQTTDPSCPSSGGGGSGGGGGTGGGSSTPTPTPTPTASATPSTEPTVAPSTPDSPLGPMTIPDDPATGVVDGKLREGASVLLVNGSTAPMAVKPDRNVDPRGLDLAATGFTMWIAGRGDINDPLGLTPKSALILQSERSAQGRVKKITPYAETRGTGFKPNSQIELWLLPSTRVGTIDVDGKGNFAGRVDIPKMLTLGGNTLQANGYTPDGVVRSVSLGIDVIARQLGVKRSTAITYFAAGSAKLTDAAKRSLDRFALGVPKTAKGIRVNVTGFVQPTVFTGNDRSLSAARAKVVSAYLRGKGLKGAYVVSGKGRAMQTGATARRVVSVAAYWK